MFLGVTGNVSGWNAEGTACSLARTLDAPRLASCSDVASRYLQTMDDNPFADFVEIPEEHRCGPVARLSLALGGLCG
jgi:hypothetical protein